MIARALRALGVDCEIRGFVAGRVGHLICQLATDEGFNLKVLNVNGESRINVAIAEGHTGRTTVLNSLGPQIEEESWRKFYDEIAVGLLSCTFVVCTGSLPPGLPVNAYGQILSVGNRLQVAGALDATGDPLIEGVKCGPEIVRVNFTEAASAYGLSAKPVGGDAQPIKQSMMAANTLRRAGAKQVVIGMSALGAVANIDNTVMRIYSRPLQPTIKFGAGDSFLAGMIVGITRGLDWRTTLKLAAAAGAASVEVFPPGRLVRERVCELMDTVQVESIAPII